MSGSPARKIITFIVVAAIIVILVPFSVSCSKPPRPTADFTYSYVSGELLIADPIAGTAPLTVQFTDQSSGEITAWRWNFGDGTVIDWGGAENRNPEHKYTAVSSGYTVILTVKGPGGKSDPQEKGIITVFKCSEAANAELNEAKLAIRGCLNAAGRTTLDAPAAAWDGSPGVVTAGGVDARDYLRTWKDFKATYTVGLYGTIEYGTDVSWGCVDWAVSITGPRWREKGSL